LLHFPEFVAVAAVVHVPTGQVVTQVSKLTNNAVPAGLAVFPHGAALVTS